jgi:hypothetical protein
MGSLTIAVLAPAGMAPRLQVGGLDGKPLPLADWRKVFEAVITVFSELKIRCACKHTFGVHGEDSPHACAAPDCACAVFTAAEPFFLPDEPADANGDAA